LLSKEDQELVDMSQNMASKSKSKLKKDIKDTNKMVESTKKPKKTKTNNMLIDWSTYKPPKPTSKEGIEREKERMSRREPEYDIIQSSSKKSNLKKDIKDTIKMVESTKKPKKTKTKNISKAIELAQLIAKEPKYVKKTQKDEVKDTINEIEKLLKAPKINDC
jgi:hypothetical protein